MDISDSSFNPNNDEFEGLLTLTALFEGDFSIDWIVELAKMRTSQILSGLAEAIRQGWLIRKGIGTFCFADSEKQKRWLDRLLPNKKNLLEEQIVALLQRELPDDDRKIQIIAPYLLHLPNSPERCCWLLRAGDAYLKAFQREMALQCYAKVLNDLSGSDGQESDGLFTEAAINYSKISTARHDTENVLSILKKAMQRAKKWNNQKYQALLEMHTAKNEWLRSRYRIALRHFEQGWALAKQLDDIKLMHSATTFSTFFLWWQGRFREAIRSYENSVPDVEKFPQGKFPVLAALTVGHCYGQIGQITQGLGMLDAIRTYCRQKGYLYLAANTCGAMGAILLDIRRIEDAFHYLKCSMEGARKEHDDWLQIMGKLWLAFAHYLKGENKRSINYLNEFLKHSRQVQVTVQPYPYLMDLCWAMEQGKLPSIPGLSLHQEVNSMIKGENVFLKGVAYRYLALLQKKEDQPHGNIIRSLNLSLKSLEESGHQIELARSQLELARIYLLLGEEEKARAITETSSRILSSFNEALIPDDLRSLIQKPFLGENLLKEILKLGQEVVTIRDNKELVQHIISTVNRITGAERGAIFLLDGNIHPPKLRLRASKNLTSGQISHPSFSPSMEMIEEVAFSGKGRVLEMRPAEEPHRPSDEIIRSRICVPMIVKNKVVGVLYHDNCLLSSAFKESDLELLNYFAGLAALALDNATAYEEIQRLNQRLKEEKRYYEEEHQGSIHFEEIVGRSSAIKHVIVQIHQVANTESTVLISGETGVGKELVARTIHRYSSRYSKPFIRVHCSALPESLIHSELFGHERGAFTGAISQRIGRFELADEGTLFLDEIGDLPLEVQVRLLRVIQTKEFERVGGSETLHSNFRLLAATNRNLADELNARRFRSDLYYRLNVFPIYVPPLRERKDDIPLLANYFLNMYAKKMGKSFEEFSEPEMEKLIQYHWPGNIRELENIIERGTILNTGPYFRVPELLEGHLASSQPGAVMTLKENERNHILWALQKRKWKVRGQEGAAELLGIHPSTLAFRMKKLGIQRP